jgi:methionyl-tRNA formyltransferase
VKFLLLSPTPERLIPCINTHDDEFLAINDKVDRKFILNNGVDCLISYNYRHILSPEVLDSLNHRAFNLHTSLLPYNRGSHPVLWSVLEQTPLGVTIHELDKGLDTGAIVFQKELTIDDPNKTLRQLYEYVNRELVDLFSQKWNNIKSGDFILTPQSGESTFHKKVEGERVVSYFSKTWDTPIKEAREIYSELPREFVVE